MKTARDSRQTSGGSLVAWGAIAVAVVGSSLTWFSTYQSTKQAKELSCIDRLDRQEAILRDKAAKFLGANGELNSKAGDPRLSIDDTRPLVSAAVAAAYELVAYAPHDVGQPTRLYAEALVMAVNRDLQEKDFSKEIEQQARQAMNHDWPIDYAKILASFDSGRSACSE